MSTRTDSHIIEHHDDGTWTETTVIHGSPATKKEKAIAYSVLGGLFVVPFLPLAVAIGIEKWERRQDRKEEARRLKSV